MKLQLLLSFYIVCALTSVLVFNGDPPVSLGVIGLDDISWTSTTPSTHGKHDFMRYPGTSHGVVEVDFLTHNVKVVEKFQSLDYYRFALFVVLDQPMFLSV